MEKQDGLNLVERVKRWEYLFEGEKGPKMYCVLT